MNYYLISFVAGWILGILVFAFLMKGKRIIF